MNAYEKISNIFEAVSAPARLQIVLAIGSGEACVCHLEALLGMRQAYISQQLMVLREKEVILSRREGKYIYYSLRDLEMIPLIHLTAKIAGVSEEAFQVSGGIQCECPKCETILVDLEPNQEEV